MTATTPEDIQISLGTITGHTEAISLAKNTGYLTDSSGATDPTSDYDWSNIADVSHYYAFGKLIPASSATGEDIFYTNGASGVGRTMKSNATFYQATAKVAVNKTGTNTAAGTADDKAIATSHILTAATDKFGGTAGEDDTNTYEKASSWNDTNDDGYYIDIPVWLRTTSSNAQDIYVCGYVCDRTDETNEGSDGDDLYKAVRVAILTGEGATNGGCLTLVDGGATLGTQDDSYRAGKYPANLTAANTNILDSDNYREPLKTMFLEVGVWGKAPHIALLLFVEKQKGRFLEVPYSGTGTSNKSGTNAVGRMEYNDGKIYGISATTPAWTEITAENSNNGDTKVATLAAGTGSTAGTPTKLIIRVWLEGEDGNCWNENAGQDWNINLKFMKDALA